MVFASLGVGGVSLATAGLYKYEKLFGVLTVVLLAGSYFLVSKNKKRINHIIYWVSVGLVVLMYAYKAYIYFN